MKRTNKLLHSLALLAACVFIVPSYGRLSSPMQNKYLSKTAEATTSQSGSKNKTGQDSKCLERIISRFVAYAKINSQSTDTADMNAFPLNEGQKLIAAHTEKSSSP